jgi:hypothetical protein
MAVPRIIYSTNTLLAYRISVKYYKNLHWVWCTPDFGSKTVTGTLLANPPSSQALHIYKSFKIDVEAGDLHSTLIAKNKIGIKKGAETKYKSKKITLSERNEIYISVDKASISEYKPLIYEMVYEDVKHLVKVVPPELAARPTSVEYIIEELPGEKIIILDLDPE